MANNPLQQHFRQPKIFIKIPTGGVFSKPGIIQGDVSKVPVYGMTGMDEIVMKTPDALLTGESISKIISSCCPRIMDPWELSNIDIDPIIIAIRIATYGNKLDFTHTCKNCSTENNYEADLSSYLEHYYQCVFDPTIVLDKMVIKIRPLSYKESNEFSMANFTFQKKLTNVEQIENEDDRQKFVNDITKELTEMQKNIILSSIDRIELADTVVTEKVFIKEFLDNCDREIFQKIKNQFEINSEKWKIPARKIKCETCGTEDSVNLELNQTNFFGNA
jgi:hypothetical protein